MKKKIYLKEVLAQMPRLLGHLNRNPLSVSYGSFDREYWHYKTTDFSCARKQEATLTLTLLYKIKDKNNPYYQNKNVLEWINAGLKFWCTIQNKDGSFAEWYPNEKSFGASAFSLSAGTEILLEFKENLKDFEKILKVFEKTGNWLAGRKETKAENQECGAIAGLYNLYLLTGKTEFKEICEKKIKELLKRQDREGWLNEYGGADIGYLSLAIDYLAKYHTKSKDENALAIIKKALEFIQCFTHPNYTCGGEYGSRNTEYLIPSGFETVKEETADILSFFIRKALSLGRGIGLNALDDRYLLYNGYTYLQAYIHAKKIKEAKFAFEEELTKHFKNTGIYIKSTKSYYAVINYFKNSFKIFSKKADKALYDSGIGIETGTNKLKPCAEKKELSETENCIWATGNFSNVPNIMMSPIKTIGIRLFQMGIGRNEAVGRLIKEKLRDNLIINEKKETNYTFRRGFAFEEDKIRIIDEVDGRFNKAFVNTKTSHSYIPSSRYFESSELGNELKIIKGNFKGIKIEREFSDKGVSVKWSDGND